MEGGTQALSSSIEKMDNVWSGEPAPPVSESIGQNPSTKEEENNLKISIFNFKNIWGLWFFNIGKRKGNVLSHLAILIFRITQQ